MVHRQSESLSEITIPEILSQIAVRQPYFAFQRIKATSDGGVLATIPPQEQPMDCERGIRAAAEIGRHLAILGSCAVARQNRKSGKHFYLAKKARLRATPDYQDRVLRDDLDEMKNQQLTGHATAEFTGNRSAQAAVRIFSDANGADLYRLDVEYAVLSPKAFERLFGDHHVEDFMPDPSLYRDHVSFDELVEDLYSDEGLLSAQFGFEPSTCAGHFPTYPALPVAVLMFILSKAAGSLLEEVTHRPAIPYMVVDAEISAEHLAFPDEKLYLVVTHEGGAKESGRYRFDCRATTEGNTLHKFGEMALSLQVVEPL